jgi:hypothetical protein
MLSAARWHSDLIVEHGAHLQLAVKRSDIALQRGQFRIVSNARA